MNTDPHGWRDWRAAIQAEATRRTFPNLLYAEKWFRTMLRLGHWRGSRFVCSVHFSTTTANQKDL